MGVQKDAGELLLYFYQELVQKGKSSVGTKEVLEITNWDSNRLNHSYHYLDDMVVLKGGGALGNINGAHIFFVIRLFPEGINMIENQPEFKKNFGFEVNLGLIKFSWGISER